MNKLRFLLNPARNPDEDFEEYKKRRQGWKIAVDWHLKMGRPFYSHPLPQQVEKDGKKILVQPLRVPYVKEKKDG